MIISADDKWADYVDADFGGIVRDALSSLSPEPDFLYLTVDVPIIHLQEGDFTDLSPKLRRLSLSLGQATAIDTALIEPLSLESFTADGCQMKTTQVTRNDGTPCQVNLIYTCPQIGEFTLTADRMSRSKHCPKTEEMLHATTGPVEVPTPRSSNDASSTCGCRDFRPLIEAIYSARAVPAASVERLPDPVDYKQLFVLSLVTNLILTCILLVICLATLSLYVQNGRRKIREKV